MNLWIVPAGQLHSWETFVEFLDDQLAVGFVELTQTDADQFVGPQQLDSLHIRQR